MMSDMGDKKPDEKDAAEESAKPAEAVQDADCNGHAPAVSAAPEQPAEPEVWLCPSLKLDAAHTVFEWTALPLFPTHQVAVTCWDTP